MPSYRTLAQMRWSDMDALGHVHNTKFLEYFELARAKLVLELVALPHRTNATLVVGRHEVDYRAPLVYRPEPIAVDTEVANIGTTSFTLASAVLEPDGSREYARVRTVVVAVDATTGEPVPISEPIRAALETYKGVA